MTMTVVIITCMFHHRKVVKGPKRSGVVSLISLECYLELFYDCKAKHRAIGGVTLV